MTPVDDKESTKPNDEGNITNELPRIGVKEVLVSELNDLARIGTDLQRKIKSAKTSAKKKYFIKKRKKNSNRAVEVIMALDRLQIAEQEKQNKEKQEFIDTRNSNDIVEERTSEENE